ncbi:MAG: LysR family transcriptional regulator, partial [Candidatus Tectomicrobia bacterium]|nr:LysR family transcriptional regulator [Candidatus Tectomicrobia bacterium]
MHIETLQLFCHVARHQSFSRGALESNVTQSAASQAVRQLEEELGVRLLDRSTRPLEVTPEGEKFYRACRELIEGFERARADLVRHQRRIAGTIRVAAIYSVGLHAMGARMQNFR